MKSEKCYKFFGIFIKLFQVIICVCLSLKASFPSSVTRALVHFALGLLLNSLSLRRTVFNVNEHSLHFMVSSSACTLHRKCGGKNTCTYQTKYTRMVCAAGKLVPRGLRYTRYDSSEFCKNLSLYTELPLGWRH